MEMYPASQIKGHESQATKVNDILKTDNIQLSNVANKHPLNNEQTNNNLSHFEINTGDSIIDVNTDSTSHEFSIATLDRKLKKLKTNKISKKKSLTPGIQCYENPSYESKKDPDFLYNITDIALININPIKLIDEHLKEIQLRIIGHTRAATIYENRDKFFGYPSTILSSFTSSTILLSIAVDNDVDFNKKTIKYVSLGMSITSFFISVSRNFLEYSKKYQSHDLSSKLYTTLLRSIEVRLISINKEYTKRSLFKEIVDQMSIIEQYERPIPHSIDQKVRSENREMLRNS